MKFSNDTLDVFKEISNIGAGNAASALAMMIDENVEVGIPKCEVVNFNDIANDYEDIESIVIGCVLELTGDLNGFIMIVMEVDSAIDLLSILCGIEISNDNNTELKENLNYIGEICNILGGSYLSAISNMSGLTIFPSIPYYTLDMVMAVMNLPISLYGPISDTILSIETDFFSQSLEFKGKCYFVPTMESCSDLLRSLGVVDEGEDKC